MRHYLEQGKMHPVEVEEHRTAFEVWPRPGVSRASASSATGRSVEDDLAATLFAGMGIDPESMVYTPDHRPIPVTHGKIIQGLLS